MLDSFLPYIGGAAAVLASLRIFHRCGRRGRTGPPMISLGMLVALTVGLTLWALYGVLRGDWVIVAANAVGSCLAANPEVS